MPDTITTCPFPLPGTQLPDNYADALDTLPVGSQVRTTGSDSPCFQKVGDGQWANLYSTEDDTLTTGSARHRAANFSTSFVVHSIPTLDYQALDVLPVESLIWLDSVLPHANTPEGMWRKQTTNATGSLPWRLVGADGDDDRNSYIADTGNCYLVRVGEGEAEAATPPFEEFTVQAPQGIAGLPVGTEIRSPSWADHTELRFVRTDEGWRLRDTPGSELRGSVIGHREFGRHDWIVTRTPDGWTPERTYTQVDLDAARDRGLDEGRVHGQREATASVVADRDRIAAALDSVTTEKQRLTRRIDELSDALITYGNEHDLDGDFDDLLGEFSDIGIKPRLRRYEVVIAVGCVHTRFVDAVDDDAAYDIACDELGFYDGMNASLDGEGVEITDVSRDSVSEA